MLSGKGQTDRLNIVWFYQYEMPRGGKFIETESSLVVVI